MLESHGQIVYVNAEDDAADFKTSLFVEKQDFQEDTDELNQIS
jgi:hypothetical protein